VALRAFADGALFADATGSGPPRVIALHGWARRGSDFRTTLAGLDALAVDLPGFGASPPPQEVIGADGYATQVAGLLQGMDQPPVVVGHSFGGRIAVCLAARFPDRVGPLVLTGVPLVRMSASRQPSLGYRVARAMNRMGILGDERMERMRRERGSADYRAATGVMRDILVKVIHETYEPQLQALQSPVTLLWGSADREVPVDVANRAAELISNAGGKVDVEILEGIGHLVPVQAPDSLRRAIDRALAG
jgi:pimeloyl-ACP methyl ester carboxylesterase